MPMLAYDDRIVGTGGFVTYEDPDDTEQEFPIFIPITSWSVRCTKYFDSITSSQNYDPNSNLLYPSRVQVGMLVEGSIAGRFRMSILPPTLLNAMYFGQTTPIITLYLRGDMEFGNGYFHLSEFEVMFPYDGVVEYQARILSEGMFSANTEPWALQTDPEPPFEPNPGPAEMPPVVTPEDESGL